MTSVASRAERDLVVLVADKDMEQAMLALLKRPESLGISAPAHAVYVHPVRDNGCRTAPNEVLRPLASQFRFALVMFDHEGSGGEAIDREQLEKDVEGSLEANGWSGRCCALVLAPELEAWVWTDSSELDHVIGWAGRQQRVRDWLGTQGFVLRADGKPERPKEALHRALRHVQKQPSASIFKLLASKAGLRRCTDPAFLKLTETLRCWFPSGPEHAQSADDPR
jgi:hypothetical protein